MDRKLAIVLIALVGIGIFALPSTVALFAGQHSFVNIDATGNQIDCIKCHGDVAVELTSGQVGTYAPHAGFSCELCHRVEAGKSSGDNAYSAITYTAVSVDDTTKTLRRTLIVPDGFAESRDVPIEVSASGTEIPSATVLISGRVMDDLTGYKYKLSGCYKSISNNGGGVLGELMPDVAEVPCLEIELLQTLAAPAPNTFQTTSLYNTDGTPKDATPSTQLGTFDASKVLYSWTGTQSTLSPYKWTFAQTANFDGAGSEISNPGTLYHAASLVSCLECHGGIPNAHHDAEYGNGNNCDACHYVGGANKGGLAGIMAGGFGLGVSPGDTGTVEAHTDFVKNEDGLLRYNDVLLASNSACVACHTHTAVDIKYNKPTTFKFDATLGRTPTDTTTFENEEATGSMISYSDNDPEPHP